METAAGMLQFKRKANIMRYFVSWNGSLKLYAKRPIVSLIYILANKGEIAKIPWKISNY